MFSISSYLFTPLTAFVNKNLPVVPFIFVSFILIKWLLEKRKWDNIYAKLPGPRLGWPLIGDLPLFYDKTKPISVSLLNKMLALSKDYRDEGLFCVYLGPKPFVYLFSPETMEPVLSTYSHTTKSSNYSFFKNLFGSNIFLKKGHEWRQMRKLWFPSFHQHILDQFVPNVNKLAHGLCQKIADMRSPDLLPLMQPYTLDIIVEMATGVQLNSLHESKNAYLEAINEYSMLFPTRAVSPWLWPDFLFNMSSLGQKSQKQVDIMNEFTSSVVRKGKEKYLAQKRESNNNYVMTKNFLNLMLGYHLNDNLLTEDNIRQELDALIIGGYDTTAFTLSMALYCLGEYPDLQRDMFEQLDSIFGEDCKREITVEDINRMTLIDYFIKETLRRYPTGPIIGRETTDDVTIRGYFIPKGTTIACFFYGAHLNENAFPNAATFDPMRWAPEKAKDMHPYAFQGFSSGPRKCPGQRVAALEMKITLATVLRRFEIKSIEPEMMPSEKIAFDVGMTMKATFPLKVSFVPRDCL